MVVGDSKDEQIAAGLGIAIESHIKHAVLSFSFPNYHHHSLGKIVSDTPYLAVGSIASVDFIVPIIGVDFFEAQIDC